MMLFTTGNIDLLTPRCNLSSKKERKSQERRMPSISRSSPTPTVSMTLILGKSQTLVASISFAVLQQVKMLSLSEE